MNYEEKYKKGLSFLKDLKPHMSDYCIEKLEWFFTELRESEDEKVRKGLIGGLNAVLDEYKYKDSICGYTKDAFYSWIAWLEKQGEQKPADSYCQKNCKGFQETGKCFADGECDAKRKAEQNSTWSEYDEQMLESCIDKMSMTAPNLWKKEIDWLKSLKPRWKPSEYDISLLEEIAKNIRNNVRPFCSEVSALEDLIKNIKTL